MKFHRTADEILATFNEASEKERTRIIDFIKANKHLHHRTSFFLLTWQSFLSPNTKSRLDCGLSLNLNEGLSIEQISTILNLGITTDKLNSRLPPRKPNAVKPGTQKSVSKGYRYG